MNRAIYIITGCLAVPTLWFGYFGIFVLLFFAQNPYDMAKKMTYNEQASQMYGSYAFHTKDFFFYWSIDGLRRILMRDITLITFEDRCSLLAKKYQQQFGFFRSITIRENPHLSLAVFKKVKSGFPISVSRSSAGGYITIYNFIPRSREDKREDVCLF